MIGLLSAEYAPQDNNTDFATNMRRARASAKDRS
jgi:hypothetical protein